MKDRRLEILGILTIASSLLVFISLAGYSPTEDPGISPNVQVENPNVQFIKPCNLCPHMKKITLPKILNCLENETNEIIMSNEIIEKARRSVERMTKVGR